VGEDWTSTCLVKNGICVTDETVCGLAVGNTDNPESGRLVQLEPAGPVPGGRGIDTDGDGTVDIDEVTFNTADCQPCVDSISWKNQGSLDAASKQCQKIVDADIADEDLGDFCKVKCNALTNISRNTALSGRQCILDFCADLEAAVDAAQVCTVN